MDNRIKVLIVCGRYPDKHSTANIFIKEQVDSIRENYPELDFHIFNIHTEKGKINYLKRRKELKKFVNANKFHIVHYHYGLTAIIGLYQKINAKQVITFHGSDINMVRFHRIISRQAVKHFDYSIVVSNSLLEKIKIRNYSVIPCGVNADLFKPMNKYDCRKQLNIPANKKLILFPGNKSNATKNYKFLKKALSNIKNQHIEVIELKNINREMVPIYMNAVDVITLTSLKEGSPQVIKEAAYCQTPIVSVDIADVYQIVEGSDNSYIVERDEKLFAEKILEAIEKKVNSGFKNLHEYDNNTIASRIYEVYKMLAYS